MAIIATTTITTATITTATIATVKTAGQPMAHRLEDDLGFLLARTHRAMRRWLMSQLAPLDITYEQFVVLTRLWHKSDLSQTELADEIFVDKSSLARMLHRMEEAGLIRRDIDETDSRVHLVNLTPEGRALEDEVSPLRAKGLSQAARGLSEEEVSELKRMLNQIFHHISAEDS